MSLKLANLIGILVVGLHQGQRTYAPRHQAGHMTATDQTVQRKKSACHEAVHICLTGADVEQPMLHNQHSGTFFGGKISTTFSPGSWTGRVADISRMPGRSQSPSGRKRTNPPLSSVIASG
jgi:hypothetical protein